MYTTCMSDAKSQIHLILPKKDLQFLKREAKSQSQSVAELIRQAIRKSYKIKSAKVRLSAFERLSKRDELVMDDWQNVKKDLLKRYE